MLNQAPKMTPLVSPVNMAEATLYQRVYAQLRDAILSGSLKPGERLPSSRAFALQLNIARNTVISAYEQLRVEGWIESVPAGGSYVAVRLPQPAARAMQASQPTVLSMLAQRALAAAPDGLVFGAAPNAFRMGAAALDVFPHLLWARLLTRRLRGHTQSALPRTSGGFLPLRHAIAAHVAVARQIRCAPEQVIIVQGAQNAFDLAARVLLNPGDAVWVEDPGYIDARNALAMAGARLVPVPVDEAGLNVEAGMRATPDARLACVTPSHQCPLGVMMSVPRRLALLDWAARHAAYVLEDDYDSDFQFIGNPIAALHALDTQARVLYCGTFSKSLFPGLRLGYLIVPPALVDAFVRVQSIASMFVPLLEQSVLADFIADGHFGRHLRRMRVVYTERRDALAHALSGSALVMQPAPTGLNAVAHPRARIDVPAAAARARAAGITIAAISDFCITPRANDGLVLGFGASTPPEIAQAVPVLLRALE